MVKFAKKHKNTRRHRTNTVLLSGKSYIKKKLNNIINLSNIVMDKRIRRKTKVFELPNKDIPQFKKTNSVKESKQKTEYKTEYKCIYKNPNGYYAWFNYNKRPYRTDYYDNPIDAVEAYEKFKLEKALKSRLKLNISSQNILPNNINSGNIDDITTKRSKIPDYVKNRIYAQQDEKCILCKKNLGEFRVMDHIKPISLGGPDNITNYQAICGTCNHWKTYNFDKVIKEYLQEIPDMTIDMIKQLQSKRYLQFNSPC